VVAGTACWRSVRRDDEIGRMLKKARLSGGRPVLFRRFFFFFFFFFFLVFVKGTKRSGSGRAPFLI